MVAIPCASLRSVLFGRVERNRCVCRVSRQNTGKPASCNAPYIHSESGQASSPTRVMSPFNFESFAMISVGSERAVTWRTFEPSSSIAHIAVLLRPRSNPINSFIARFSVMFEPGTMLADVRSPIIPSDAGRPGRSERNGKTPGAACAQRPAREAGAAPGPENCDPAQMPACQTRPCPALLFAASGIRPE